MTKIIASLLAALPLLGAAQDATPQPPPQYAPPPADAQPQAAPVQPQYAPPPAQYPPQYPPQYAPAPQYTPPPPQGQAPAQGQYAPPPQNAPPAQTQGQYAPPPQYAPAPQYPPPPQGGQAAPPQYAPPPQYPPQYGQPGRYPQQPPPQYGQPARYPQQPPPPLPARQPYQRDNWYIGFSLGGGDGSISLPASDGYAAETLSFKEFFGTSPSKFGFTFRLGATLTPRLLLGGELGGFAAAATYATPFGDATRSLSIGTMNAIVTFFPFEHGLFVRGGLGLASLSSAIQLPDEAEVSDSTSGGNFTAGVGYALWLGRTFNLSANLDYAAQAYGSDDVDGTSYWTLGLGFDWY